MSPLREYDDEYDPADWVDDTPPYDPAAEAYSLWLDEAGEREATTQAVAP